MVDRVKPIPLPDMVKMPYSFQEWVRQVTNLLYSSSGVIPLSSGGTSASLTASIGGIVYSTASALAILSGTATARQMLQSGASAAPAWSTTTWPATSTAGGILLSTATNVIGELAAGATTTLLVGGGVGTVPVWTTATGSGAPVRENTPTLITPNIGAATGASLNITGQFISTLAIGTPPLVVTSTTKVTNLNADLLDDQSGTYYLDRSNHTGTQIASTISDFTEAAQDAVGAMVDTTLVYVDGTPLLTRGAITGDISVPQASNTSTLATVNANVGTFGTSTAVAQLTANAKGLITAVAAVNIVYDSANFTGTNWTDLTDAGATILHKHDHGGQDGLADNDHPQYLLVADIDDVAVNGEVSAPISSNWAFDHVAAADPHTGYRLESADHTHQSTGAQAGQLDHGLALTGLTDDDHTQYLLASAATDRATFVTNWTDLTDGGATTLHTHAATGVTNFHALVAAHVSLRA